MKDLVSLDPPQLITVRDDGKEIGFLAIDSLVANRCCGGLRMMPDVSGGELCALAHSMTLKYGFLGLPQGGAKAGVCGEPSASLEDRRRLLEKFARGLGEYLENGIYAPGTDMGTTNDDIRWLLQSVGVKIKSRQLHGAHSGDYTAMTVFYAARQACRRLGIELGGAAVAIEGFGSVGSSLAGLFFRAGASVTSISTVEGALYRPEGLDVNELMQLRRQNGDRLVHLYNDAQFIERAKLHELPVDVFCPCARHHSITIDNASSVKAHLVCQGANNPLTDDAEAALAGRGVLCIPDFVANSGGVLGGTMEFAGWNFSQIETFLDRQFSKRIDRLLEEAQKRGCRPRLIAEPQALQRFEETRHAAENPTPIDRIFSLGLEMYRRGMIPAGLTAALSRRYFESRLA